MPTSAAHERGGIQPAKRQLLGQATQLVPPRIRKLRKRTGCSIYRRSSNRGTQLQQLMLYFSECKCSYGNKFGKKMGSSDKIRDLRIWSGKMPN